MSAISSPASRTCVKPIIDLFIVSAPALVVMMMMMLRKSALRPLLSVSVPWSITCSSTLKMSGCAFSISSSSSTACGFLVTASVKQAALVEADVARRRADQAADGMALHVLRHVEADQLDAHDVGQLLGRFGLADAGGAGEQERADRLVAPAQARARHLHGGRQHFQCLVLAEHHALQVAFEGLQLAAVVVGHVGGRNARDLGHDLLDLGLGDRLLALAHRQDALGGTGLVDDVDGLVRQVPVVDVLGATAPPRPAGRSRRTSRCGAPRSATSGPSGSRWFPARSARPRRPSGSGATGPRPSRRCRGTR